MSRGDRGRHPVFPLDRPLRRPLMLLLLLLGCVLPKAVFFFFFFGLSFVSGDVFLFLLSF